MRDWESGSTFRLLFAIYGCWFGPPVVEYDGRVIDGRQRLGVLGSFENAPRVVARHFRDAARLLVCAGHHDRALELLRDRVALDETIGAVLHLPPCLVAPLLALHARQLRERRRNRPRKAPRRRAHVVENMRRLVVGMAQGSFEGTPEELRAALGEWAPPDPPGDAGK